MNTGRAAGETEQGTTVPHRGRRGVEGSRGAYKELGCCLVAQAFVHGDLRAGSAESAGTSSSRKAF